jgi:hypothetical protein
MSEPITDLSDLPPGQQVIRAKLIFRRELLLTALKRRSRKRFPHDLKRLAGFFLIGSGSKQHRKPN